MPPTWQGSVQTYVRKRSRDKRGNTASSACAPLSVSPSARNLRRWQLARSATEAPPAQHDECALGTYRKPVNMCATDGSKVQSSAHLPSSPGAHSHKLRYTTSAARRGKILAATRKNSVSHNRSVSKESTLDCEATLERASVELLACCCEAPPRARRNSSVDAPTALVHRVHKRLHDAGILLQHGQQLIITRP